MREKHLERLVKNLQLDYPRYPESRIKVLQGNLRTLCFIPASTDFQTCYTCYYFLLYFHTFSHLFTLVDCVLCFLYVFECFQSWKKVGEGWRRLEKVREGQRRREKEG